MEIVLFFSTIVVSFGVEARRKKNKEILFLKKRAYIDRQEREENKTQKKEMTQGGKKRQIYRWQGARVGPR